MHAGIALAIPHDSRHAALVVVILWQTLLVLVRLLVVWTTS